MKIKRTARIFLFTLLVVFLTITIGYAQEDNNGVFRPSEGKWYLDYTLDGTTDRIVRFGMSGDNPVVGDFDRDGTTDIGVFRCGEWILDYGIDGTVNRRLNYGLATDTPLVGDFNNDGIVDIGVFRSGEWILDYGIDGTVNRRFNYGLATDKPIVGNFNNDGTMDIGVFRSGEWILDYGIDGTVNRRFNWGLSTDKPVVGDFNNDGITDIGVYRSGQWILDYGITGNVDRRVNYGGATDIPVVGKWIPPPQTEYKVYAEVGDSDLVNSAQGFWDNINGVDHGGKTWIDSGRQLITMNGIKTDCPNLYCPKASHWTTDAAQWIGQADFLFFSGHGNTGFINFDDDNDNKAFAENMGLNSTWRIKWVVFDSCATLNGTDPEGSAWRWLPAFNTGGLHMFLGWHSNADNWPNVHGDYRGLTFAKLIKGDNYYGDSTIYSMLDAWYLAGYYSYKFKQNHVSHDAYEAVMYRTDATGTNGCKYDYLPGYGNSCNPLEWPYVDWDYIFVWPKDCTINCAESSMSRSLNLSENNYSLDASVPVASDKIMIYMPVKSEFTKEGVISLAKNLGMAGDIRDTEDAFYANGTDAEQSLLVIQKNSSSIIFRKKNDKLSIVQSEAQSITDAKTFLQKNNMILSDNLKPRVVNNRGIIFTRSGERVGEWKTNVVLYQQVINGLPVLNARYQVEVDSDGNIVGFIKNWCEYKPFKEVSLKSPEDAFREFQVRPLEKDQEIPETVNVTSVALVYQMNQSAGMEFLEPVYIFDGYNKNDTSIEPFDPVVITAHDETMVIS